VIFHDIDESRSIPWKRRPRAQDLLAEMRLPRPARRFDAVVVGEPQRAFGDALQTATIVPVFVHHGIPLYVPELGGPYHPTNDSHDIILGLFGGMSKAERNRIRIRVRSQMQVHAKEGRYLGGRPPYGCMLEDAGPHPNPGTAADGKRLQRHVPDPIAAPVVARIYDIYRRQGLGIKAIAQRLTDEGIPSPSGHDPAQNRHRANAKGAWSRSAVRAILGTPAISVTRSGTRPSATTSSSTSRT
jgi:DNA invertase Pin-like site-specific DNA recombinase